jgi:hypothetical protein
MTTFSYPINTVNGSIQLTTEENKKIPEVIKHILQTEIEDRPLNPEFGIEPVEFNFLQDLPRLLRSLEYSLSYGLSEYPGVYTSLKGYEDDTGIINVDCYWEYDDTQGLVSVNITP